VEWNASPVDEGGEAIALNCTMYWGTAAGVGAAPTEDGRAIITDPAASARTADAKFRLTIIHILSL
jgi:hypothetical protein